MVRPPPEGGARGRRSGRQRLNRLRIGVVGSRHFADLERVERYVAELPAGTRLVTGSASGVDAAAIRAARRRGLNVQVLGASLEEERDPSQAAERNQRLVELCDRLVAFWDGSSAGTRGTIDRALDAGREVQVFVVPGSTSISHR